MGESLKMLDHTQAKEVLKGKFYKKILPKLWEFIERKTLPKEISLEAENLFEFRLLLEFFDIAEKDIINTIAHENAHANKASSFENKGVKHLGYMLKITVAKNGESTFMPQARLGFPDEFRELKKDHKEIIKAVYSAPLEYGDKLSTNDIEVINKLG